MFCLSGRGKAVSDFVHKKESTVCALHMAAGLTDGILNMTVKERLLSTVDGQGFSEPWMRLYFFMLEIFICIFV